MEYEVVNNFLDHIYLKKLQDKMFHNTFAWFMSQDVTLPNSTRDEYYFTHLYFDRYKIMSPEIKDLFTIINKLKIKALIRIKANLYPRTSKIQEHELHSDYPFSHKSALFSINTNNGYTYFEDGTKIESVENRMLLFDASKKHGSSTCTDQNYRCNIVFNYF